MVIIRGEWNFPQKLAICRGDTDAKVLGLRDDLSRSRQFRDNRRGVAGAISLPAPFHVTGFGVESEPSPSTCVTPVDTFPPPPPTNVDVVANVGAISIVWDASPASDLAGYVVLRGTAPATTLEPITPTPIALTRFVDTVPSGTRYVYAVQAVDTNGNRSEPSARVEESAR